MRLSLMLAVIAVVICVMPAAAAPPYPGVVSIDSIDAKPGDHVALGIHLGGGQTGLTALRIPIKFNATIVQVDSISYIGTAAPSDIFTLHDINNSSGTVNLLFYPDFIVPLPTIPASGGLLATIHGTISNVAPQTTLTIDTIYQVDSVIVNGSVVYFGEGLQATDSTGTVMLEPDFLPGKIRITLATGVDDDIASGLPTSFAVNQNYPNPFNPSTVISFSIPKQSPVKVEIFNILGQQIATIAEGGLPAGNHEVTWNADGNPSGVYFYRVTWNGGNQTRKMVLLK